MLIDHRTPAVLPILKFEVTISLKHLSNFWRFFHLPLISCETELDFSWRKDIQLEHTLVEQHNNITGVNFIITSTKLMLQLSLYLLMIISNL